MRLKSIVKVFFFTLFVILCFIQCYIIMKSFLDNPQVIGISEVSPDLVTILPGITICNNNRLSLKKLVRRNSTIRKAIREKFPSWIDKQGNLLVRPIETKEFNSFRDEIYKIFGRLNYSSQEELDNSTMNDLFDLKPDPKPFVSWVGCARTWNNSIDCNELSHIDSIQDRSCTTILHEGAMLYDSTHKPEFFNSSKISDGRYSYFNAKEVVKIATNFEPEDYADLKRQIGARIIFHGNNLVASSSDPDYFVTRGYKYDFNIGREDLVLYDSGPGCTQYKAINLPLYKNKIDPRVPLDGSTCFQNCVVRNVIHRANCWPTTMPYYRNDTNDPNLDLKSCGWFRQPPYISIYRELLRVEQLLEDEKNGGSNFNQSSSSTFASSDTYYKKEMRAYMKIRRNCWSQCTLSCRLIKYSITVTRSAWPSNVETLFDKTGKNRVLRHCCALISIKYSHFHYNVHEFMPKYNLVDTIGNLGGLLAVWLNLSMVEVYHAVQKLLEFFSDYAFHSRVHVQESYKF